MSKTMPCSHKSATTLAALKELAAKPLASATAMPKDMYVSPSIFQLEIERLFHGEWICAIRDQRSAPADDARPGAFGRESSSGAPVGEHAALEPADGPVWRGCLADGCADCRYRERGSRDGDFGMLHDGARVSV